MNAANTLDSSKFDLDALLRKWSEYEIQNYRGKKKQDSEPKIESRQISDGHMFQLEQEDFAQMKKLFDQSEFSDGIFYGGEQVAFLRHPRFSKTISHSHSFIELIYVYSGECRQIINNTEICMKEGEICILNTNAVHAIRMAGENDIIINCMIKKDYFDSTFLSRLAGNNLFSNFFVYSIYQNKKYNDYILFPSGKSALIQEMMQHILCEYFERDMCFDEVINSYMIVVFTELLRIYMKQVDASNFQNLKNTNISDIVLYIQNNYRDASLEETARYFNFHPNYLSKIIKDLSGRTFMEILHEARMNRACILLNASDIPVNSIIHEIGYTNTNFFYKKFHQYKGMTPAEFRKKSKEFSS